MYLLDTNICIYLINRRPYSVLQKFVTLGLEPADIKLSAIGIAEMEYGLMKSKYYEQSKNSLINFAASFEILPFDSDDAETFGMIKAELEKRGQLIGPYDMQIGAQALRRGLVLVTNNTGEFRRIRGLTVENWAEGS
jgi:tRNA(fMet)-specific endonuclease VapC